MGTITIRGPEFCRPYVFPYPNGPFGLLRFVYNAIGVPCVLDYSGQTVSPHEVAAVLRDMQQTFRLGLTGNIEILCTTIQMVDTTHPSSPNVHGIRVPGFIALSATPRKPLRDLLSHEITHELEHHVPAGAMAEFWDIIDQDPIEKPRWWQDMPQERFGEYVSTALWAEPLDDRMPILTPETIARVREWALRSLPDSGPATIVIGDQAPETRVILTPGSTIAQVDGTEVTLEAAPELIRERTMVPIRLVAEAFGHQVHWTDPRVYIGDRIVLTVGSTTAVVDGHTVLLDVAPVVKNGRTLVPIRFVAEALGRRVHWDEPKNRVLIW